METKTCTLCRNDFPLNTFQWNRVNESYNTYCKECRKIKKKESYGRTKREVIAKNQIYAANHAEEIADYQEKYREENRDKIRKAQRHRNAKNRIMRREAEAARRGLIKATSDGFVLTPEILDVMYESQKHTCPYCDGDLGNYHVDHIHPIAKGGRHRLENLCLACASCNLQKKSKILYSEWVPPKDRKKG